MDQQATGLLCSPTASRWATAAEEAWGARRWGSVSRPQPRAGAAAASCFSACPLVGVARVQVSCRSEVIRQATVCLSMSGALRKGLPQRALSKRANMAQPGGKAAC